MDKTLKYHMFYVAYFDNLIFSFLEPSSESSSKEIRVLYRKAFMDHESFLGLTNENCGEVGFCYAIFYERMFSEMVGESTHEIQRRCVVLLEASLGFWLSLAIVESAS
jgi:hypothetical protein